MVAVDDGVTHLAKRERNLECRLEFDKFFYSLSPSSGEISYELTSFFLF